MTGTPAAGIVYVFTPNTGFVTAAKAQSAASFALYPQPAQRQLTIDLRGTPADAIEAQLIDSQGRIVHTFRLSTQQAMAPFTVSLPVLSTGLYALSLRSATLNWQIQRLMVAQ